MNMIDLQYIIYLSIFIAVCTVGIVQLIKNFIKTKKGKLTAIISILVSITLGILNTDLVPMWCTIMVDLIFMSISISQLAWDILAKGVPALISNIIDKKVKGQEND